MCPPCIAFVVFLRSCQFQQVSYRLGNNGVILLVIPRTLFITSGLPQVICYGVGYVRFSAIYNVCIKSHTFSVYFTCTKHLKQLHKINLTLKNKTKGTLSPEDELKYMKKSLIIEHICFITCYPPHLLFIFMSFLLVHLRPQLNRLCNMRWLDFVAACQVCNSTGHFQNPVVAAGA